MLGKVDTLEAQLSDMQTKNEGSLEANFTAPTAPTQVDHDLSGHAVRDNSYLAENAESLPPAEGDFVEAAHVTTLETELKEALRELERLEEEKAAAVTESMTDATVEDGHLNEENAMRLFDAMFRERDEKDPDGIKAYEAMFSIARMAYLSEHAQE